MRKTTHGFTTYFLVWHIQNYFKRYQQESEKCRSFPLWFWIQATAPSLLDTYLPPFTLKAAAQHHTENYNSCFFPCFLHVSTGHGKAGKGATLSFERSAKHPAMEDCRTSDSILSTRGEKKASEKEDASLKITGEDVPLRTHSSHSQSWHWGWQILKWPTRNRSGSISASLPQRKAWQERTPRPDLPSPRPLGWQPQRHPEPSTPRTPPAAPQPHTCPPSYHVTSPFGVKK